MALVSFAVADAASGRLRRVGVCKAALVARQARAGEVAVEIAAADMALAEPSPRGWRLVDGALVAAEPPAPSSDALAAAARARRDRELAASDWTQLPDAPVDRAAWAAYRAALRDLPAAPGWPEAVAWPERPAG